MKGSTVGGKARRKALLVLGIKLAFPESNEKLLEDSERSSLTFNRLILAAGLRRDCRGTR